MSNKYRKSLTFQNAAAIRRAQQMYRKQLGLGLDGKPRRYGRPKKEKAPNKRYAGDGIIDAENAKEARERIARNYRVPQRLIELRKKKDLSYEKQIYSYVGKNE